MIVGTEKVLAGSGWVPSERTLLLDGRVTNDKDAGWKGGRPKVHSGQWLLLGLRENLKTINEIFEKKIDRKIKTLSLNSRPEFRNYRMKFIV